MFGPMKQTLYTALGAVTYTAEQLQKNAQQFLKESGVSDIDTTAFVQELQKKTQEAKEHIATMVKEVSSNTIKSLQLPTREEFEDLQKKVAELEKKITPKE